MPRFLSWARPLCGAGMKNGDRVSGRRVFLSGVRAYVGRGVYVGVCAMRGR